MADISAENEKLEQQANSGGLDAFDVDRLDPDDYALKALEAHNAVERESNHGKKIELDKNFANQQRVRRAMAIKTRPTAKSSNQTKKVTKPKTYLSGLLFLVFGFCLGQIPNPFLENLIEDWASESWLQPVSSLLQIEGEDENQEASPILSYRVTSEYLNVRRGPGIEFEIVGTLKRDQVIEAQPYKKDWVKVDFGRYAFARSLRLVEAMPFPSSLGKNRWVHDIEAKVYIKKNRSSKVLKTLKYGDQVLVGKSKGGWTEVKPKGFVRKSLIASKTPLKYEGKPFMARVTRKQAVIVGEPSTPYKKKGVVFKDRKVKVIGVEDGWARIGEGLYIKARYLESF